MDEDINKRIGDAMWQASLEAMGVKRFAELLHDPPVRTYSVADMILDGSMCEGCGVYVGDAVGYPRYCTQCAPPAKVSCPQCGKKVNRSGLKQHQEAKHNER